MKVLTNRTVKTVQRSPLYAMYQQHIKGKTRKAFPLMILTSCLQYAQYHERYCVYSSIVKPSASPSAHG